MDNPGRGHRQQPAQGPDRARRPVRYDEELAAYVARADAIVLPYHRSSMSGPLHVALAAGLPVVVTAVGGLVEAVQNYAGAVLVPRRIRPLFAMPSSSCLREGPALRKPAFLAADLGWLSGADRRGVRDAGQSQPSNCVFPSPPRSGRLMRIEQIVALSNVEVAYV